MYRILYQMHRVVKEFVAYCEEEAESFINTVKHSGGSIVDVKPIYN